MENNKDYRNRKYTDAGVVSGTHKKALASVLALMLALLLTLTSCGSSAEAESLGIGSTSATEASADNAVSKSEMFTERDLSGEYDESEAETLSVLLEDPVTKLSAELLYGVFEKKDIITRAVRFRNGAQSDVILNKALSMSLDIPYGRWDLIHFHGKHTLERQIERERLTHLVKTVQPSVSTLPTVHISMPSGLSPTIR